MNVDHKKLKDIRDEGIHLQTDLKTLQNYLQSIDLTVQDFQKLTNDRQCRSVFHQYQHRFELLSIKHAEFLQRIKNITNQYESLIDLFNEINYLNNEFLKTMNEFDQHLSVNRKVKLLLTHIHFHFCFSVLLE